MSDMGQLKAVFVSTGQVTSFPTRVRAIFVSNGATGGVVSVSDSVDGNLITLQVAANAQNNIVFDGGSVRFRNDCSVKGPSGVGLTFFVG